MRFKAFVVAIALSTAAAAAAGCGLRGSDTPPAQGGLEQMNAIPAQRLERAIAVPTPTPSPIPAADADSLIPSTIRPYMSMQPKPAVPIPYTGQSAKAAKADAGSSQTGPQPKQEKPKPAASVKPKKERSDKKSVPVQQNRIAQKALSLAQIRQKYSHYFKVAGSSSDNKIALTFDDGPDDRFTAQVLDVLKTNRVKATFFVIGSRAATRPDLIERMVREGHIVGNHSYSHALLPKLTEPNFERQIEQTQTVIKNLTGYAPRLFRPPYGAVNEEQVRWAAEHHYLIVNWNVDSLDWKGLSAQQVTSNILSTARAGSIILQHCGGGDGENLSGTVQALPAVIQKLRSQGYQFVTVPELLHVPKAQ